VEAAFSPSDSIARKLFVLTANCHSGLNQPQQALEVCLRGQSVCPDDAELLFLESALREEQNDLPGAKTALPLASLAERRRRETKRRRNRRTPHQTQCGDSTPHSKGKTPRDSGHGVHIRSHRRAWSW
jgi:hypothetical protein